MKQNTFPQHFDLGVAGEKWRTFTIPGSGRPIYDANGNPRCVPIHTSLSNFELLTAAALTIGNDPLFLNTGTGTEVIARAAKGGENIKSQASSPASGDNVFVASAATTNGTYAPLSANAQPRFRARVNLTQITALYASAGFDQNVTTVSPAGTAGDGAKFLFDPTGAVSTLAAGTRGNWILCQKVNNVNTYTDTGLAVVAGQDYELEIQYGPDLIPTYFIDGVQYANALAIAGTANVSVGVLVGLQLTATPGGQKDMDIRYVSTERFMG